MSKQIGMTQNQKRVNLEQAAELLRVAKQLSDLPTIQEDIDVVVKEYRNGLVELALEELGYVIEVADAEIQPQWSMDPRNPAVDTRKRLGFGNRNDKQ